MYYDVFHIYDHNQKYLFNVATQDPDQLYNFTTGNNYQSEYFDHFFINDTKEEFEEELIDNVFKVRK